MPEKPEDRPDEEKTFADWRDQAGELLERANLSDESKLLLLSLSLVSVDELDTVVKQAHEFLGYAQKTTGTTGLLVINWQELCRLLEKLEANPVFGLR